MTPSIKPVQECRSLEGWMPVIVASASNPDKKYTVLVNPWGDPEDNVCECRGFQYRGSCRHLKEAVEEVCGWNETEGTEQQTPEQRKAMICPRCRETTKWTMEVSDADELD